MKWRKKGKPVILNKFKTTNLSNPIISINLRIKDLAQMVDEMNNGEDKFSLEELVWKLDALLLQLQTNGGGHYARRK